MVVCLRREGLRGYQLSLQRFRFFLEGSVGGVCFGVDAGLFFFLERRQGRTFFLGVGFGKMRGIVDVSLILVYLLFSGGAGG